jgi:S1-C subfamily serine protease
MRWSRSVKCAALLASTLVVAACVPPPPMSAHGSSTSTTFPQVQTTTTTTLATSSRLLADARHYVFRVRNVACLATGSSFAAAAGIVTNRHVASGSTLLQLSTWDGRDFNALVRAISGGPDLALLSDTSIKTVPTIRISPVPAGTQVWAAGYPEGNQLSVKPGIVLDYVAGSKYGEPGGVMEITNPIQPGNSGGPLLDSSDRVVGVVVAIETATGDGLAIPASAVAQFVAAPGANISGGCIP